MNIQGEDTSSSWEKIQELGQGGFGDVRLYRNTVSGKHIAIKTIRRRDEYSDAANRIWERWRQEVFMMKKLNHDCVVKALAVPPELDSGPEDFPALGMEFCEGGDLRKLLSRPENCCGLREVYVRDLLRCVASAIEYLHNKQITHRDLKPENIVLQPNGEPDRFLYKIIDLGYAKELDPNSSCMLSHVGTQQYLAPELNGKKTYTRTVDYWSFGCVVFECITGRRPFLPDLRSSVQWHDEVSKKSPEDITAFHDDKGIIHFSKKIPEPTHLCVPLKNYLEQWLKLMLRWDSRSRGGGVKKLTHEERPKCFCVLEQILEMKLFHVMLSKANLLLSFPVNGAHTIETVHQAIQAQTNIPVAHQLLIHKSGVVLQPEQLAIGGCQDSSTENPAVFLLCRGSIPEELTSKTKLPVLVELIVKEPQTVLSLERHKKAWKSVVYFCALENITHKQLVTSERSAMKALLHTVTNLVKQKDNLSRERLKLSAFKEYFKMSLDFDLELHSTHEYLSQAIDGHIYRLWQQSSKETEKDDFLVPQLDQFTSDAEEVQQTVFNLELKPSVSNNTSKLEDCENDAKKLYEKLRSVRVGQETLEHGPMVDIVGKCVVGRDELTGNLHNSIDKVTSLFRPLESLLHKVNALNNAIQTEKQNLVLRQRKRQEDLWKLSADLLSMQNINLTADASIMPVSMWNGSGSGGAVFQSMSTPMESIRLVDDSKTSIQKVDDMLEEMEKDHEESIRYFSSVND